MTIHLPKELERFVHEAVRAGRYADEDDVIRDALVRLKETMPERSVTPEPHRKPAKSAKAATQNRPLTVEEVHQRMLAAGLITELPNRAADIDDADDLPIAIEGEPLSETIIRERR
jgi:Arc/MetJ-type ribon-helix-helix transcriptional regulator